MADHFITKTSIAKPDLLAVGSESVLASDAQLREAIASSATPELASFFAVPVLGPEDANGNVPVSWYSDVDGRPRPMDMLEGPMREDISERLELRFRQIDELKAARPDLAEQLTAAQSVLSRGDVLAVSGQPVAINWGARPAEVAPDAHFAATFGQLLPRTSAAATPFAAAPVAAPAQQAAGYAANTAMAAAPSPGAPSSRSEDRRPWNLSVWPLAVLALVLLGILIWLLWPGTRLFPPAVSPLATEIEDGAAAALRDHNADLAARAAALEDALRLGQCTDDGQFILPDGRTPEGLLPTSPGAPSDEATRQDATSDPLLPPNPERVQAPDSAADGTGTTSAAVSIVDLIERNSVLVVTETGIGTGFFISPDVVFTNHHVIEEAITSGRVFVVNEALQEPISAEIIRYDGPFETTGGDFALLRVAARSESYFALLDGAIEVKGQGVIAAGYPGDIVTADLRFEALMNGTGTEIPDMVVTNGIVNTEQQIAPDVSLLIHSASISQGNSGGPLVDLCGRVIGMNTFVSQQAFRSLNLAQTAASLGAFLASGTGGDVVTETTVCAPNVAPVAPPVASPAAPAEDDAE